MPDRTRPVRIDDVIAVKAIEDCCFPNPWDIDIFVTLASSKGCVTLRKGKKVCMQIIEHNSSVAGYVVWEDCPDTSKGRVLNIAVRENLQRRGFGRSLIQHVFDSLAERGIKTAVLEVREGNLIAHRFYERMGMEELGRVPNYYDDEDAIIYSITL
jgi:ribosomal-protein-alanine N-acetyltransferase